MPRPKRSLFFLFLFFASCFLLSAPATTFADITTGLVGYWTFDGKDTNWTTGITLDKSGNGNNGSLINMSTTTSPSAGKVGQALYFYQSAKIAVTDSSSISNLSVITACAWIKPKPTIAVGGQAFPVIVSKYDANSTSGWDFYLVDLGDHYELGTSFFGSSPAGYTDIEQGTFFFTEKWVFVCAQQNGNGSSNMKLYYNGDLVGPNNALDSGARVADAGNNLLIGNNYSYPYKGSIDDVRIYNRILSAAEIKKLYTQNASKFGVSPTGTSGSGLNSGLIAWWTFDGKDTTWTSPTAATTLDKSGNGNTGTLNNMSQTTSPVAGKIGQALTFNQQDTNDSVGIGNVTPGNFYTVSFWIKPSSYHSALLIGLANSNGIQLYSGDGTIYLNNSPIASGCPTVPLNSWSYITVTYSSGSVSIYKNGISFCTFSQTQLTYSQMGNDNFGNYFQGSLDDVRIYNRILSATEITQLYKQGSTKYGVSPTTLNSGLNSGLVGYWTFDGKDVNWTSPTAGTVRDASGNGNTGTMNNVSQSTSVVAGKIGQGLLFHSNTGSLNGTYVSTVNDYSEQNGFTYSVWANLKNFDNGNDFFTFKDDNVNNSSSVFYCTGAGGNNILILSFVNSSQIQYYPQSGNGICEIGKWHMYSATYDGASTVQLYRDGVPITSSTVVGPISDSNQPLQISHASTPANGTLDDVRAYNRALSASEMMQLYKLGASKSR